MSITLKFQPVPDERSPQINLQFIPARAHTKLEEETNIAQFFNSYTTSKKDDQQPYNPLVNTLRGYPVSGDELPIPSTHLGVVFQEDKKPLSENAPRTFRQKCQFEKFTLWNYDLQPSANDAIKRAVNGFCMSEEIHQTVDPNELAEFIKNQPPSRPEAGTSSS